MSGLLLESLPMMVMMRAVVPVMVPMMVPMMVMMAPVVMRAYVAAGLDPAVADPSCGADKADFFGLLRDASQRGREAHGLGAAAAQRHGPGQRGQCRNCDNESTHSFFLP
ncbi:hypothetical protein HNQ36_001476 [Afipia massiliensis]|uniref:Uncharacterized protein n=1 Tax=Afipia massiliensis TaxID=211460 RepID=A0A840MXR5_9BRAD|nr:hypothetical protein [Afipia massiliensis]MBB5051522.1 hypothetical protein [Afipia massiliensis]